MNVRQSASTWWTWLALTTLITLALVASGCGSNPDTVPMADETVQDATGTDGTDTGLGGMPNPADIERSSSELPAQFTGLIRHREADDFRPDLPQKYTAWMQETETLVMDPAMHYYDPDMAYATFEFDPAEMPYAWEIHLDWETAPPAGECWVGLSNYGNNRWEWISADGPVTIPEPHEDYLGENDDLYVIVLVTGLEEAYLRGVWIGDNQPPVAHLNTDGRSVVEHTEVILDAGLSFDPEGGELTYYWDIENDGEIDFTTNTPELPVTYEAGWRYAAVWLGDGTGAYSRDTTLVSVAEATESGWLDLEITPRMETVDLGFCLLDYLDTATVICYEQANYYESRTSIYTTDSPACTAWNREIVGDLIFNHSECRADPVALEIGDQLAVLEVEYNGELECFQLLFRLSSPANSAFWDVEKVLYTMDAEGESLKGIDLELIDGRLALLFSSDESLYYMLADSAVGTHWGEPVLVTADYFWNGHPCDALLDVGGMPAICYLRYDDETCNFSYIYSRAQDAEGTGWTEVVLEDSIPYNSPYSYPLLLAVEGKPFVLYRKAAGGRPNGCLHLVRALDELGDTWDDAVAIVSLAGGMRMDAEVLDGRPVVAYDGDYQVSGDTTRPCLYYAAATDGTATDWNVEEVAFLSNWEGADYVHLAISNGAPVIAVNHFDGFMGSFGIINIYTPIVQ